MNDNTPLKTKFGIANIDEKGYYRITSRKEGNRNKRLHQLIWESYYGEIPENMVIHHIDGNKTNNNINNLKLISKNNHSILHNLGKKCSEETKNKIADAQKGENNPAWKNYPRLTKGGFRNGKRNYVIRFNGKRIKQSINKERLVKWFEVAYPNENLIIEVGVSNE